MIRAWLVPVLAALAAACAHPLEGRIWHPASGQFVDIETLWGRASEARHLLLGEVHDSPEHHRFQRDTLEALARAGQRRALAMEQFDVEHQPAIDRAPADAEAIADAGRFDRRGWHWPLYEPLVSFAVRERWPLLAANLARAQALTASPGPADPAVLAALERDMVDGHCGHQPGAKTLASMVNAQRARDMRMAQVIAEASETRTVLIAGNGHVRRDRGVPLYMGSAETLAIGQVEVRPDVHSPADHFGGFATVHSYDYVRFTPRTERPDPCAAFRGKASLPAR